MTSTHIVDHITDAAAGAATEQVLDMEGALGHTQKPTSPVYPRLITHEAIMIRSLAIADNLDEVLMLPQGFVFPLKVRPPVRNLKSKIKKTQPGDGSKLRQRKDQDDYYEDYE